MEQLYTPILGALGVAIAAVLTWLANRGIAAYEKYAQTNLTEQQRQTVLGAMDTAAGLIKLELAKGALSLSAVRPTEPEVKRITENAMIGVSDSVKALGVTPEGAAKIVAGRVGNALPDVVAVPPVPKVRV